MNMTVKYMGCHCRLYKKNKEEFDKLFRIAIEQNDEYRGDNFNYCPWCGKKIEKRPKPCRNCGEKGFHKSSLCKKCRKKLWGYT